MQTIKQPSTYHTSIIFQYLCPCTETHLRASSNSTNFPEVIPRTPVSKGGAKEGKRRIGLKGMKWKGKMKGRGGDGRGVKTN
jgi:hypothetical protein